MLNRCVAHRLERGHTYENASEQRTQPLERVTAPPHGSQVDAISTQSHDEEDSACVQSKLQRQACGRRSPRSAPERDPQWDKSELQKDVNTVTNENEHDHHGEDDTSQLYSHEGRPSSREEQFTERAGNAQRTSAHTNAKNGFSSLKHHPAAGAQAKRHNDKKNGMNTMAQLVSITPAQAFAAVSTGQQPQLEPARQYLRLAGLSSRAAG